MLVKVSGKKDLTKIHVQKISHLDNLADKISKEIVLDTNILVLSRVLLNETETCQNLDTIFQKYSENHEALVIILIGPFISNVETSIKTAYQGNFIFLI